jgi:hypothetical protein
LFSFTPQIDDSIETRSPPANPVALVVPFSVFPSSYRSDAAVTATEETKSTKVEGEIELEKGREGHSETRFTSSVTSERQGGKRYEEDVRISENRPQQQYRREEHVHISEREREPKQRFEQEERFEKDSRFEKDTRFEKDIRFEKDTRFEKEPRFEREARFEEEPRERIERVERVESTQRER